MSQRPLLALPKIKDPVPAMRRRSDRIYRLSATPHRSINRIKIQSLTCAKWPWYTKLLIGRVSLPSSNERWFDFERIDRCADGFDSVNRIHLPRIPMGRPRFHAT
jgi:hypothetical protein